MTDEVVELKLGFWPEAAISGAVLVATEVSTFLTFNAIGQIPDGKRENIGHALIEFIRCQSTKFGYPNDEALPSHRFTTKVYPITVTEYLRC